ncbi:MAG: M2 family metallopeptidase [Pseudomonadota bacterium]
MRFYLLLAFALVITAGVSASSHAKGKDGKMLTAEANAVVEEYLSRYKPLDIEVRKAWYKYNTTGDKKASEREAELELAIRELASDKGRFEKLKALYKDRKDIDSPVLRREVEVLYLGHLPNQVSKEKLRELTELEKRLQEGFNDYRAVVDGKKLTPVETAHILAESTDSAKLEKVWKAEYSIGPVLEKDYRAIVKLRNEIARELGFKNALELSAATDELDLKMLDRFYGDITKITEKPFRRLKEEFIDPRLARRYGISVADLRPWHYQNAFFQEAPTAIFGKVDLDELYSKTDAKKIIGQTIDFYGSLGLDIHGIVANSSLFPKPGKNPHAVAWLLNPDKPGSSILIMNLPDPPKPPKASEASTLVHELAHDINYEAILNNKAVPYLLRDPTMLTEAVAMLFERQTQTAEWFKHLGVADAKAKEVADAVAQIDYVDQLVFLRWSATIYCFERGFYDDPDRDIGDLWWECKAKYQFEHRPEGWKSPDAMAKYHITNAEPLYYSNYAIGRIANVQFADLLAKKIGEDVRGASYFGKRELGDWLMADFLAQGELYRWDDFLERSTGKPLSVDAWKKYYMDLGIEEKLFAK